MKTRSILGTHALVLALLITLAGTAAAQVATLQTPGPEAQASEAPAEELDGQDAVLGFTECMRDKGVDLPDPQFGVGAFFAHGALEDIDFLSARFLGAFEACQGFLAAAIPEADPEQQAEQIEQAVAFAECMREQGIDFPDPDPASGMSFGSMLGEDGGLAFDPFDPAFQSASRTCADATGVRMPGVPTGS